MFGNPFAGPTPSQELISRKPEDLSLQSALYAWNVGFGDGANNATHALFDGDGAEGLQMFYDDGYERGQSEKSVVDRMNARHGLDEKSKGPTEPSTAETPVEDAGDHGEEARAGEASIEITVSPSDRDALAMARDGAVIVVAAAAVAAVAIEVWRGGRG